MITSWLIAVKYGHVSEEGGIHEHNYRRKKNKKNDKNFFPWKYSKNPRELLEIRRNELIMHL